MFLGFNNMPTTIKNKKEKMPSMKAVGEEVRRLVVEMSERSHSGETGSSLSISDLLPALYFKVMNVDPQKPHFPERDRFVLSKGHGAAAYYATLHRPPRSSTRGSTVSTCATSSRTSSSSGLTAR